MKSPFVFLLKGLPDNKTPNAPPLFFFFFRLCLPSKGSVWCLLSVIRMIGAVRFGAEEARGLANLALKPSDHHKYKKTSVLYSGFQKGIVEERNMLWQLVVKSSEVLCNVGRLVAFWRPNRKEGS